MKGKGRVKKNRLKQPKVTAVIAKINKGWGVVLTKSEKRLRNISKKVQKKT